MVATIGLRRILSAHAGKRRDKSIRYIRESAAKIAGVNPESVRISGDLNRLVMVHAGRHIRRIKVKIVKEKEIATVKPFEEQIKKAEATAAVQKDKKEGKEQTKKENKK